MKRLWYAFWAWVLRRNLASTPKALIIDQMNEPRPLPLGRQEFEEWSERIIAGAMIPCVEEDKEVFVKSQKAALANMIMHLGPNESHKPDAHFIHFLRKVAVNQVVHTIFQELQPEIKARTAAKEAALKVVSETKKG